MKKTALIGLMALMIGGCSEHKPKITYSVVGGFVGYSDKLVIDEKQIKKYNYLEMNGIDHTRYAPITKEEYKHLDDLLHKADFFSLNEKYASEHVIYDALYQIIQVSEEGKNKTVSIETCAKIPKELTEFITYINYLDNEKFGKGKK